MNEVVILAKDDDSDGTTYRQDASEEGVNVVLAEPIEPEDSMDSRSRWYWFRLPNGDLVLGCYPQGKTYLATEAYLSI